jgi:hypothetical protein
LSGQSQQGQSDDGQRNLGVSIYHFLISEFPAGRAGSRPSFSFKGDFSRHCIDLNQLDRPGASIHFRGSPQFYENRRMDRRGTEPLHKSGYSWLWKAPGGATTGMIWLSHSLSGHRPAATSSAIRFAKWPFFSASPGNRNHGVFRLKKDRGRSPCRLASQ